MDYYANIDFTPIDNKNYKSTTKEKYITRNGVIQTNTPQNICNIIDDSSLLLKNTDVKDNSLSKLNNNFITDEYELTYSNKLKKDYVQKTGFYYNNKDIGAGRGFGNLNISSDIRYGNSSRLDTKEFKEQLEGTNILDYQFQYLDRNFQDPNYLILPIPRGGTMTRKQNQVTINTNNKNNSERTKSIQFLY